MTELRLDRPAFAALLDMVAAQHVIGLDIEAVLPEDSAERSALVAEGLNTLAEFDLARQNDEGRWSPHPVALTLVTALAHAELGAIIVRSIPEVGRQQLSYAQRAEIIVEFTQPEGGIYRLAALEGPAMLVERIAGIAAMPAETDDLPLGRLALEQFVEVKELVEDDGLNTALVLLRQADVPEATALALIEAMENPIHSVELAMLKLNQGEAVDARSAILLRSAASAWIFEQEPPDVPMLGLRTIDHDRLRERLRHWYEALL